MSDVVRFTVRGGTMREIRQKATAEIERFLSDDPRSDVLPMVSARVTAAHIDMSNHGGFDLMITYYDAEIEVQL